MTISINHSPTEKKVDKTLKQLPYNQSKQEFITTAIDKYIGILIKEKVVKR